MGPDVRAATPALDRLARSSWIAAAITAVVGTLAGFSVVGLIIVPAAICTLVALIASALGAHLAASRFPPRAGRRPPMRHVVAALP